MLVVKIALWPFGQEELEKPLGVLIIANVGRSFEVEGTCNYRTAMTTEKMDGTIASKNTKVLNWDRTRPVQDLVKEALEELEKVGDSESPKAATE